MSTQTTQNPQTTLMTMNDAKGTTYAGVLFFNPRNAIGVTLSFLSRNNKRQACFACTVPGCKNTHVREQSDWHLVGPCRDHASKPSAKVVKLVQKFLRAA